MLDDSWESAVIHGFEAFNLFFFSPSAHLPFPPSFFSRQPKSLMINIGVPGAGK
jgi:hypothetical protein